MSGSNTGGKLDIFRKSLVSKLYLVTGMVFYFLFYFLHSFFMTMNYHVMLGGNRKFRLERQRTGAIPKISTLI